MTATVIQASFLGDQPKLQPPVAARRAPTPPPIQAKVGARLPGPRPTALGRPPGPPMPAFARRPVQPQGAGSAFAVQAGPLGLASSGGRPLPEVVRGKMEAALGADFSNVRVHVGPQAERIGAIAFTLGSDIYFAPGRYQPDTAHGQQLLGHELAHVVQQRAGRVRNPLGSGIAVVQDKALEAEADRLGRHAAAHRVAVQPKMPPGGAQPSTPVRISSPINAGPGSYRLTAATSGHQVGSVMVHARDRGVVEVTDLGVDPAHREHGIGRMLLASAARTGLQSGKSKVTLAAEDNGSGRLTHWYKGMGFTQVGINQRGYPQMEAPIGRVLAGVAQRREVPIAITTIPQKQSMLSSMPAQQIAVRPAALRSPVAVAPRVVPLQPKFAAPVFTPSSVLQRMDSIGSFFTNAVTFGSALFKDNPNPFEMEIFTSCVCLVFNTAGEENYREYKSARNIVESKARKLVFNSIKGNWDKRHHPGTFFALCPYDENDMLSQEWQDLMLADKMNDIFGDRPLIVILGHCSPGSDKIYNDGSTKGYDIKNVIMAIRPALKSRTTIYLTPCSTGVDSADSDSFQKQFTDEMAGEAKEDTETLIIGTGSTSFPFFNKVLTTGQTYSHVKSQQGNVVKRSIKEDVFLNKQRRTAPPTNTGVPQPLPHPKPLQQPPPRRNPSPQPPRRRKPLPPLPTKGI